MSIKNKLAAAGALVSLCAAPAAMAATVSLNALLNSSGPAQFNLTFVEMGTTGYSATPGLICSSTTACNSAATSIGGTYGDDTWGVFTVSSISVGSNTWSSGFDGNYLRGMFYGSQDSAVSFNPFGGIFNDTPTFTATGVGGIMDIYQYGSDLIPTVGTVSPGTRTSLNEYTGFTSGSQWMSLGFDTFTSNFALIPGTASADSSFAGYGSVDPAWATQAAATFDQNKRFNGTFFSDFRFTGGGTCDYLNENFDSSTCDPWTTAGSASAFGNAVPEPGSMALAGLGLMGLAAMRRRKQQA